MSYYDEIEIEDMIFHKETSLYTYPCPCGDQFEILLQDLRDGEDVAVCPSCSLMIKVIFEAENLPAEAQGVATEPLAVAT
ncbi:MAG: Diphthamide biosynthesis protein 3 [Heterodermia speciosa]|uniref:Diphthamide biosynthesis protein 3 n=1 Tax=Heterodermia speciosa TaxID=116794 RepID=A0A8H3FTI8_9LECA|nr:MAG: Diphthamide biosynthesis protein 3 [Heterodermia speciosa]